MKLDSFFNPKSVALIGASRDSQKLGHQILANLINFGYQGKIYPINPQARVILGQKVYSSISIVRQPVDLVIIALPAVLVLAELEKCGQAKAKNVIIIAAGFGELNAVGKQAELRMNEIAKRYKMNILGPNCLGLISSRSRLNASFAPSLKVSKTGSKNNIALVSQSGAIASAVLDFADQVGLGFSNFVSLGNEAQLTEADIFSYLASDRQTELVAVYLEQIKDGSRFLASLSRLAKIKPVIILKAGQTEAGLAAAKSHTGSLAGSYQATKTAIDRSGAIMVESLSELFSFLLLSQRLIKTNNFNLGIISNAGGPLVLSADVALNLGLVLPSLASVTEKSIKKQLPALVAPHNPLDILGDADAKRYQVALKAVLADTRIGNLLVILTPQTSTEIIASAEAIVMAAKNNPKKNIVAVFIGGQEVASGIKVLRKNLIPAFTYPETALLALSKLFKYYQALPLLKTCDLKFSSAPSANGQLMDFMDALRLLGHYQIAVAETKKITNEKMKLKYPLVIKVVGPSLLHKSEYKAVFPKVESAQELKKLWRHPLLTQPGNYLIAQERIASGVEMILGFRRDAVFGPLLMVGYGGVYTEVFKDIAWSLVDLNLKKAREMVASLKSYPLLSGFRGGEKLAVDELAKTIVRLAKLAKEHPEIAELDINPLFVLNRKVKAADVRIIT